MPAGGREQQSFYNIWGSLPGSRLKCALLEVHVRVVVSYKSGTMLCAHASVITTLDVYSNFVICNCFTQ